MTRQALAGVTARRSFRITGVPMTSRAVSIPAPVEGWDAITPVAAMPEKRAITLRNMFPQPGYVEIRKGHKRHNNIGAAAVESLLPYHGLTTSGDRLFAAATTAISNVTVFTTASASSTSSISMSGLTNARWQHVNFSNTAGNFLWICNGADAPLYYDGSAWATASVVGVTAADIINVAVFKERIWLARKDTVNPAYLAADAIAGTATPFDLSGVFNKGGFLQAIGTWTRDGGDGPDDLIAFVTSRGEVAVYAGTDPASNFNLQGVYEMGAPIGRRCLLKVGADLAVISMDGVLPLSRALVTDRAAALIESITKLIQPVMNAAARDNASKFGWQLIAYPRGTRAILNVPLTENVEQQQFVMNTVTGAWAQFTEENANCWAVFQDRLFFGGNNGIVYEADCQGFDEGDTIEFDLETAFNYCGSRSGLKQFTMARALLTTDGQISPGLAINVDFATQTAVNILTFPVDPLALWDVALWDAGTWPEESHVVTDWVSVSGMGYCASIRINGQVEAETTAQEANPLVLAVNGFDMLVLDGAFQ